jgi:hypothetical protein
MLSIRSGSARIPVAPLASLFALAVLAMAWVASAHVCARPIVMASMPGMDMTSMPMPSAQTPFGSVTICPVVLGLIVLSTLLAAWAIVTCRRDPHAAVSYGVLARTLARLPVFPTFVALASSGGLAIGTIVAVDGGVALSLSLCATLAALLAGIALAATLCSLGLARLALALCARLIVTLARAIGERAAPVRASFIAPIRPLPVAAFPIAFGRGLRAPPPLTLAML